MRQWSTLRRRRWWPAAVVNFRVELVEKKAKVEPPVKNGQVPLFDSWIKLNPPVLSIWTIPLVPHSLPSLPSLVPCVSSCPGAGTCWSTGTLSPALGSDVWRRWIRKWEIRIIEELPIVFRQYGSSSIHSNPMSLDTFPASSLAGNRGSVAGSTSSPKRWRKSWWIGPSTGAKKLDTWMFSMDIYDRNFQVFVIF